MSEEEKPEKEASGEAPANEPEAAAEVEETPEIEQEQPQRKPRTALSFLVSLIAVAIAAAGVGGGFMLWKRLDTRVQGQAQEIVSLNRALTNLGENPDLRALRDELGREALRFREENQTQQRQIDTLEGAIKSVHDLATRDQRGWVLAETEYLIRIAIHRLRLTRDIDGTIAALQAADQRLHELSDPTLLPVREQLADDIQVLKDFERPDLVGIALRLDRMTTHLKPLPVALGLERDGQAAQYQQAQEPGQKSWEGFALTIAEKLGVRVSTQTEPLRGLQEAENVLYLHQMLRLQLEGARLAALRQDDAEYHRRLEGALKLIDEFHEHEDTHQLTEDLKALNEISLRPELPVILGSLKALQKFRQAPLKSEATAE